MKFLHASFPNDPEGKEGDMPDGALAGLDGEFDDEDNLEDEGDVDKIAFDPYDDIDEF